MVFQIFRNTGELFKRATTARNDCFALPRSLQRTRLMARDEKPAFALEPPQMTILSDHPSQSSIDVFLRMESGLAVVLDILRHRHTRCPITIAIYGDWGTGKTFSHALVGKPA